MTPHRILVIGRLFEGLKSSILARNWKPSGVPAFYRLVEDFHSDPDAALTTILVCNDPDTRFSRTMRVDMPETGPVLVLPWRSPTGGHVKKLDRLCTAIEQTVRILWFGVRNRFDLIYATYALIGPAGLLARLTQRTVVLRLMGIFPHHRAVAAGKHRLLGWLLKSPFAHVFCTEDGSDPSRVLPRLLKPGIPWSVRLNGCDVTGGPARSQNKIPRILFLGRLESYKGCIHFLDAALQVLKTNPGSAKFELIGDGPLKAMLQNRIDEAKHAPNIHLRGALPHDDVTTALRNADIYVSVNLNGNLSNANLEALSAGMCMVIPTSDPGIPLDTATDEILPADVVLRYDRTDLSSSLASLLTALVADPARIKSLRSATESLGKQLLRRWTDCVAEDKRILYAIAHGKAPDTGIFLHKSSSSISSSEAE